MASDWPEAVSDGLTLPCHRCGKVPLFDYRVSDALWQDVVPKEWRLGVVCLPCLNQLAPGQIGEHLEEVQFTGHGETVVLRKTMVHLYKTRPPQQDTEPVEGEALEIIEGVIHSHEEGTGTALTIEELLAIRRALRARVQPRKVRREEFEKIADFVGFASGNAGPRAVTSGVLELLGLQIEDES